MSNSKANDTLISLYIEVLGCSQDVQTYAQYVCKKVKDYAHEALENFLPKMKKSVTPVTDRASGRIAKVMDTLIAQLKVGIIFVHTSGSPHNLATHYV